MASSLENPEKKDSDKPEAKSGLNVTKMQADGYKPGLTDRSATNKMWKEQIRRDGKEVGGWDNLLKARAEGGAKGPGLGESPLDPRSRMANRGEPPKELVEERLDKDVWGAVSKKNRASSEGLAREMGAKLAEFRLQRSEDKSGE